MNEQDALAVLDERMRNASHELQIAIDAAMRCQHHRRPKATASV